MCGITGFVGQPDSALLERMCSIMEHRGPDEWGTREAPFASIGMRRLSIIDIEGGHQPVQNEDGTVWAVLNGEIYNYVELRQRLMGLGHSFRTNGDTETLVHLYEEYGDNFVEHLRGMFACAILDLTRERLLVARDRVGEKPLYWSRDGGRLWFGSEQKCILAARGLADVDRSAVADFMGLGYVPGTRSFHSHIQKLLPGDMLVWERGEAKVQTWFRFAHGAKAELSEAQALEGLSQHLDDAAKLTLRADVEVGAFLSGGLDSSLVTALARRHQAQVKTFSVGYRGAAEGFNELSWARQVSEHLGTEHHELIIEPSSNLEHLPKVLWHFDEPHGEPTSILVHQLSSFVRQHVKVALGGTGGDELFFGYPRYQAVKHLNRWVGMPGGLRSMAKAVVSLVPEAIDGNPLVRRARRFVSARGDSVEQAYADWLNLFDAGWRNRLLGQSGSDAERMVLDRLDGVGPLFDRAAAIDVDMYLPEYQLAYMDRMSMAVGLEVRSPLVDWELAQYALSLPAQHRFRDGRTKHLLKEAARGLISQDIIDRKKVGFDSPIGNWLRGELRGFATAFLAPEQIARTGLLAPDAVAQLLGEHLGGKADHSMQLWAVLAVEAWYRMTFEGGGVTTAPPDLADLRGAPAAAAA